jgi:hypothetical protein
MSHKYIEYVKAWHVLYGGYPVTIPAAYYQDVGKTLYLTNSALNGDPEQDGFIASLDKPIEIALVEKVEQRKDQVL